jgi:hypothetical protein
LYPSGEAIAKRGLCVSVLKPSVLAWQLRANGRNRPSSAIDGVAAGVLESLPTTLIIYGRSQSPRVS